LPGGRPKSREILFRVLFETEINGEPPLEALEYAFGRYRLTEDGRDHAMRLLGLVVSRREECDRLVRSHLANWEPERLSTVVRTILRLSTAELLGAPEVPARVVLDQAVELAKKYGEDGADGFVNGVLDPIAAQLRPTELGPERNQRPSPTGEVGGRSA
jgi:N utilization substance protein B